MPLHVERSCVMCAVWLLNRIRGDAPELLACRPVCSSRTDACPCRQARDMALDYGHMGIRVNCVSPGPILTDGGTVQHAIRENRPLQEICDELAADVSLRRMGQPDECARAIAFLASDEVRRTETPTRVSAAVSRY